MALGADVSDVFAENDAAGIAPVAAAAAFDPAVEFATTWLADNGITTTECAPPWDLAGTDLDAADRYVVRVVSSGATDLDVRFSSHELAQMNSAADVCRKLIILEKLSGTSIASNKTTFRVLHSVEDWQPDFATMKPLSWSLPVSAVLSDKPAAGQPEADQTQP